MPARTSSRNSPPARPRVRRGSEADAERLRDEILAAALALFIEGGLDAVTMRAVATRVGVSAMTPYRYFEDKGHLLRGIWHHVLAAAVAAMRAAAAGVERVDDRIRANLNAFIDYWEAHPQHYRLVYMTEQTLRADAQGVFTTLPAYAGVIDESQESSRQLALQIGGDPGNAKLASDLRFMMVSGYLHSRLVNRRYPWTAADVLRPVVIECILEAMASCLRNGPVTPAPAPNHRARARTETRAGPLPRWRSVLDARDLGADQRRARHDAGVGHHEGHRGRPRRVGIDGPVGTHREQGHGGVDAARPAVARLEALQRILGHEQEDQCARLRADLPPHRTGGGAVVAIDLAVIAQLPFAVGAAHHEAGRDHAGEDEHATRLGHQLARAGVAGVQAIQRFW